jgi:DNA-directed RNA polymerase specialized sigma24 family protein
VDEVLEFCRRVLGSPELAQAAAARAQANSSADRLAQLAHAARGCRERAELADGSPPSESSPPGPTPAAALAPEPAPPGLAAAVALELEAANARLPERHREAMALRELLGLSYDQIAAVMGLETAAVGPLLARARLRLRSELRGPLPPSAEACTAQERAIRLLARRQDSEPVSSQDEGWLLEHLDGCGPCAHAHAAMLEASVCYRGWWVEDHAPAAR